MEEIRFEVRHPDGRLDRLVVHASRATIGTGAHCDVRLAVDQAAPEHVTVELVAEGVRIRKLPSAPPATLDGAPLEGTVVPERAILRLAGTLVQITRAERVEVGARRSGESSGSSVRIAIGLGVLAILGMMVMKQRVATGEVEPDEEPRLFAEVAPACPRADGAEARVLAADQLALAEAARERSPFAAHEALTAVKSYDVAGACYRVAGAAAEAAEADAASKELRLATLTDFRARRVRLARTLAVGDDELAASDVGILKKLTEGQKTEFTAWLDGVAHDLRSKGTKVP